MRMTFLNRLRHSIPLILSVCIFFSMNAMLHADYSFLNGDSYKWVKIIVSSDLTTAWGQASLANDDMFNNGWQCRAESWVDGGVGGSGAWSDNCSYPSTGFSNYEEYYSEGFCGLATAQGVFWLIKPGGWEGEGSLSATVYTQNCSY